MTTEDQIGAYIATQEVAKQAELQALHSQILHMFPQCKVWFNDGKDNPGKVVSNPSIGYGAYTIRYANGTSKEFFRVGISGNKSGLSVYIMGLADKKHLENAMGSSIGKATVSGYCIKFKSVKDINLDVLYSEIKYRMSLPN